MPSKDILVSKRQVHISDNQIFRLLPIVSLTHVLQYRSSWILQDGFGTKTITVPQMES